jgi:hypothetical protein
MRRFRIAVTMYALALLLTSIGMNPAAAAPGVANGSCAAQWAQVMRSDGSTVAGTYSVAPPAGFNPITATDAQLQCYGFPPRPINANQLTAWTNVMSHLGPYIAPVVGGATRETGATYGITPDSYVGVYNNTGPWYGYLVLQSDNNYQTYNYGSAEWTVPATHNCANTYSIATWVGIGGIGAPLEQAGVESNYQCWTRFVYEDRPRDPQGISLISPAIAEGQTAVTSVQISGTTATYFLDNTQGGYTNIQEGLSPSQIGQNAVDFVLEVPQGSSYGWISTYPWQWTYLQSNTTSGYTNSFNYRASLPNVYPYCYGDSTMGGSGSYTMSYGGGAFC